MAAPKTLRRRRVSAIDLKSDMNDHKNGKFTKHHHHRKGLLNLNNSKSVVQKLYYLFIILGIITFVIRISSVRKLGEVGCIARQGKMMYFIVGCSVLVFQLITLGLLRKIKDEFAIRRGMFFSPLLKQNRMLQTNQISLFCNQWILT